MGLSAGGTRSRAPGVAVWLGLLFLAILPAMAFAADPRANDEAVIRAFHRRVSEIKRMMESEHPPAQPEKAAEPDHRPVRQSLQSSPAEELAAPRMSFPPAETNESATEDTGAAIPPPGELSQFAASEPLPELEHLQLQAALAEDRLRLLEEKAGATHTLAMMNLALLAGVSAGGVVMAKRGWKREKREAPRERPKGAEENLQEGISCYRIGRLEQALDHLNRALAADGALVPAYLWRGNLFFRLRQFGKAHHDYLRMFQLDPDNRSAFLSVVELYLTAGQYAPALEVLELGAAHRHGPEAEALFAFFEYAARSLAGLQTTEAEVEFRRAMGEDFVLTWSLREIVRWLQTPELPQGARMQIVALVRQLQSRGGRLTGYGGAEGRPGRPGERPEYSNESFWEDGRVREIG